MWFYMNSANKTKHLYQDLKFKPENYWKLCKKTFFFFYKSYKLTVRSNIIDATF